MRSTAPTLHSATCQGSSQTCGTSGDRACGWCSAPAGRRRSLQGLPSYHLSCADCARHTREMARGTRAHAHAKRVRADHQHKRSVNPFRRLAHCSAGAFAEAPDGLGLPGTSQLGWLQMYRPECEGANRTHTRGCWCSDADWDRPMVRGRGASSRGGLCKQALGWRAAVQQPAPAHAQKGCRPCASAPTSRRLNAACHRT